MVHWALAKIEGLQTLERISKKLLLDLEENLQKLKKKFFIRKEAFDKAYTAFEKLNKK